MMREAYFVDTGIWKAHFDSKDQWHRVTEMILREITQFRPYLFTTDVVLLEFIALARSHGISIDKIDRDVEAIIESTRVEYISETDLKNARQILLRYPALGFSGVDVSTLAIMDRLALKNVLTVDEEFRKCNRFVIVRPDPTERKNALGT
jgi:predicted nucleic acid-binding protein